MSEYKHKQTPCVWGRGQQWTRPLWDTFRGGRTLKATEKAQALKMIFTIIWISSWISNCFQSHVNILFRHFMKEVKPNIYKAEMKAGWGPTAPAFLSHRITGQLIQSNVVRSGRSGPGVSSVQSAPLGRRIPRPSGLLDATVKAWNTEWTDDTQSQYDNSPPRHVTHFLHQSETTSVNQAAMADDSLF